MSSELRARVITAVVAVPLFLALILLAPKWLFAGVLGFFILVGAWEWSAISRLEGVPGRALYSMLTVLLLVPLYPLLTDNGVLLVVLFLGLIWWITAILLVVRYQLYQRSLRYRTARLFGGWAVLIPAWAALVWLQSRESGGPYYVLVLFIMIWLADIGAYFTGRAVGRTKLASRVSPGKTVEGGVGGLLAAVLFLVLEAHFYAPSLALLLVALLGMFTVVMSVLGDLLESMYKRDAGIKDSGNLFPGHGGVLDRIDSVTAAAPIFALGLVLLEIDP